MAINRMPVTIVAELTNHVNDWQHGEEAYFNVYPEENTEWVTRGEWPMPELSSFYKNREELEAFLQTQGYYPSSYSTIKYVLR